MAWRSWISTLSVHGVVAIIIGGAVDGASPLIPPPASQIEKPNGLWSRPSESLGHRGTPELAPPDHEGLGKQDRGAFRSARRPAIGPIDSPGVFALVAILEVAVLIPAVGPDAAGREVR